MTRNPIRCWLGLGCCVGQLDLCQPCCWLGLMIRTLYRQAATDWRRLADFLHSGSGSTRPGDPPLWWPVTGSLMIGIGMGFCNTAFLVFTQASVGYGERGMATSSIMFMRIVGNSVGAAVYGAILNYGVSRRIPEAGETVNWLSQPAARHELSPAMIARKPATQSPPDRTMSTCSPPWSRSSAYSRRWPCRRGSAQPAPAASPTRAG